MLIIANLPWMDVDDFSLLTFKVSITSLKWIPFACRKVYTRLQKFYHNTFYFDSSTLIRHSMKKCHCYDPPPITIPQLWGVITVKIFEKIIFRGAREKTKICRPWLPELWEGWGRSLILFLRGHFYLSPWLYVCQLSAKKLIRNFLWNVSKFY